MLQLLEKDYIIVELNKDIGHWGQVDDTPEKSGPIYGLVFTIQVNGKIKKHTTQFRVRNITENTTTVSGLINVTMSGCGVMPYAKPTVEIQDYGVVYEVIELLNDFGYSIDRDALLKDIELQIQ